MLRKLHYIENRWRETNRAILNRIIMMSRTNCLTGAERLIEQNLFEEGLKM